MASEGLISYHRGNLRLVDPDGLRTSACECYDIIRAEMDLVLPGALGPPI
jgi:hypothetical protein